MALLTRWTWVWVNPGSLWWTGRPGVLWFMGSQSPTGLSDWTELCVWFLPWHKGVVVDIFLGSLVQSYCGEGGTLQTNNAGVCAPSISATLGMPPLTAVHPPCPHSSGSRLLCPEPLEAGPGLHAPLRSKPLRFRHSGSPQRRRICWACVLCPSQLWAAWVMMCLASAVTATYRLSHPCHSIFWVYNWRTFSGGWLSRSPGSLSKQRSLLAVW